MPPVCCRSPQRTQFRSRGAAPSLLERPRRPQAALHPDFQPLRHPVARVYSHRRQHLVSRHGQKVMGEGHGRWMRLICRNGGGLASGQPSRDASRPDQFGGVTASSTGGPRAGSLPALSAPLLAAPPAVRARSAATPVRSRGEGPPAISPHHHEHGNRECSMGCVNSLVPYPGVYREEASHEHVDVRANARLHCDP